MQLSWTLPFHLLYRLSSLGGFEPGDIEMRWRRLGSCTPGAPHCFPQKDLVQSEVNDEITGEKVSLCYTNKMQLCVGLNTFLIVLLHSRFIFPMFLPHASLCCACLMLGRTRCFKLLVTKDSIEGMVFLVCQPLQNLSTDHGKEILLKDETSLWKGLRDTGDTRESSFTWETGTGLWSKGCNEMYKWIKKGGSFQLVFLWAFLDLGKSTTRRVLK